MSLQLIVGMAFVLCMSILHGPVLALEKAGVALPDTVTQAEKTLVLNGAGVREATIFAVDVYVMGLYLEQRSSDPLTIINSTQDKHIIMHFVRSVSKDKLTTAWTEGVDKNAGDPEAVRSQLKQLNDSMADVSDGDTIVLAFHGDTVTVQVKGGTGVPIVGSEFQKALLSVWLGSSPPNRGLKAGLLGRS